MTSTPSRPQEKAPDRTTAAGGAPSARPKRTRRKSVAPGRQPGSPKAKRIAALVLEVLAGERRPSEAAEELGVSRVRYYFLESRAMAGLIAACEAQPAGPRADPDRQVARLTRELDRLRHTAARYQALSRAAHRALGIVPPKPAAQQKKGSEGKRRRRRRPTVRALKAAREMRRTVASAQPVPAQPTAVQSALAAEAVP